MSSSNPTNPPSHEAAAGQQHGTLQEAFIHKANKLNQDQVRKAHVLKLRNRYMGLLLGGMVVSIYGYTLYAVKQEKFLDELDEPEK